MRSPSCPSLLAISAIAVETCTLIGIPEYPCHSSQLCTHVPAVQLKEDNVAVTIIHYNARCGLGVWCGCVCGVDGCVVWMGVGVWCGYVWCVGGVWMDVVWICGMCVCGVVWCVCGACSVCVWCVCGVCAHLFHSSKSPFILQLMSPVPIYFCLSQ